MVLGSHFNYWVFPTVIILITVHRPSLWLLSLWTRINLRLVAEVSWNAAPFWQPKIRPSNGVHHVDALILINDNMSYLDPSALFNRVIPDGGNALWHTSAGQTLARFLISTHYRVFSTNWESTLFWSFRKSTIYFDDESNYCDTFAVAHTI